MNKIKITLILGLVFGPLITVYASTENSQPQKASKNSWRASFDISMSQLKAAKGLFEGGERYGVGGSFGITIPIKESGFWAEPMLGASYLNKFDKNNLAPAGLLSEIRVFPMIDVGYSLYIISPFVGVQATAHILTDTKPDNYSENMLDFSFRFGFKIFEVVKAAVTYTPLPDKSIYGGWGGFIGVGIPF